jgi:hypothetical protein
MTSVIDGLYLANLAGEQIGPPESYVGLCISFVCLLSRLFKFLYGLLRVKNKIQLCILPTTEGVT